MTPLHILGWGAVSPAGWNTASLIAAMGGSHPLLLPPKHLPRPKSAATLPVLAVPAPPPGPKPQPLSHPRLRRSSAISQHAAVAATEALQHAGVDPSAPGTRLGIVFATFSGCVAYSRRFYEETLANPATASPLLFPETVINAPASHLAAVFQSTGINYSTTGDASVVLAGLTLARHWLSAGGADLVLLVAAEEVDWLTAEALACFQRHSPLADGAAAFVLSGSPAPAAARCQLTHITAPVLLNSRTTRRNALANAIRQLPDPTGQDLLVGSWTPRGRVSREEQAAWAAWPGARLAPKAILGEGLAAAAGWQLILACDAVASRRHPAAVVSVASGNEAVNVARISAT